MYNQMGFFLSVIGFRKTIGDNEKNKKQQTGENENPFRPL